MIISALPIWQEHYRVTTSRDDLRELAKTVISEDKRLPSDAAPGLLAKIAWACADGRPLPVIEVDRQELELLMAAAGAPA